MTNSHDQSSAESCDATKRQASKILFGDPAWLDRADMAEQMDDEFVEDNGSRSRRITPNQLIAELNARTGDVAQPTLESAAWQVLGSRGIWLHIPTNLLENYRSTGNEVRPLYASQPSPAATVETKRETEDRLLQKATIASGEVLYDLPRSSADSEPVGYQFRQRSGVGKGPQSSAPWCDWCFIERETYEKYQREPNKLVQVRPVFASEPQAAPIREALVAAQRIIERDFPNGQLAIDIRNALASSQVSRPHGGGK